MFQLYSIFDKKSSSFGPIQVCKHVADATRAVAVTLEDRNNNLSRWPADYALYLVGTFDPATGGIFPSHSGMPEFTIEVGALVPVERMVPGV